MLEEDKNMDQYGNGRKSVILELMDYTNSRINEIKNKKKSDNPHTNSINRGEFLAWHKLKNKLETKIRNLKPIEKKKSIWDKYVK
jgi:hypothetical protein